VTQTLAVSLALNLLVTSQSRSDVRYHTIDISAVNIRTLSVVQAQF